MILSRTLQCGGDEHSGHLRSFVALLRRTPSCTVSDELSANLGCPEQTYRRPVIFWVSKQLVDESWPRFFFPLCSSSPASAQPRLLPGWNVAFLFWTEELIPPLVIEESTLGPQEISLPPFRRGEHP